MLRIDNNLLQEVGLASLPDSEKNSLLRHIYETLEMRVGIRLADQMSNEQLDEFERYFEAKDDAGAFKWLESNFPNYKEIVQEEFEKLKAEVAQSAPQILSSSTAAQSSPQPMAAQASPAPDPYYAQPQQPQSPPPMQQGNQNPIGASNPVPPAPAMPQDINMPQQAPPSYNPSGPTQTPYNPNPAQSLQPDTPQYPDQQPPAGPGAMPQY